MAGNRFRIGSGEYCVEDDRCEPCGRLPEQKEDADPMGPGIALILAEIDQGGDTDGREHEQGSRRGDCDDPMHHRRDGIGLGHKSPQDCGGDTGDHEENEDSLPATVFGAEDGIEIGDTENRQIYEREDNQRDHLRHGDSEQQAGGECQRGLDSREAPKPFTAVTWVGKATTPPNDEEEKSSQGSPRQQGEIAGEESVLGRKESVSGAFD